jgi:NitT/TauT family transport system ATP-binding protein
MIATADGIVTTPTVVEVSDVSKVYVTLRGDPVRAVDDVSFSVPEGKFFSLIGPSGCGKSTILSMVAGLVPPSTGLIRIDGQSVSGPQTDIGIVFQTDALLEWRSAFGNVMLQAEARNMPREAARARARELLTSVGLGNFFDVWPRELSGGMRQRVAICRALIHDPAVLLMDEPFGALDALTRDQLGLELAHLWDRQEGKTAIFITHDIQEAAFLSDRIVVMTPQPGRIGAIIDVPLPRPRHLEVRDTHEFLATVAEIRRVFEAEGVIHE